MLPIAGQSAQIEQNPACAKHNSQDCFDENCLLEGENGMVRAGEVAAGDKIMTLDHGLQIVRWVGRNHFESHELMADHRLAPVLIRRGSLAPGAPRRRLRLSQNHRLVVRSNLAQDNFGQDEILVRAIDLYRVLPDQFELDFGAITYVNLLFDNHEIILAENVPIETIFAGAQAFDLMSKEARAEIKLILPQIYKARFDVERARKLATEQDLQTVFVQS